MTSDHTYRCLGCFEGTVSRPFDVSNLTVSCPSCGSFERLLNEDVFDQYQSLEDSPPEHLDWSRLDRAEKLLVSERVVRSGRSIEDFEMEA